MKVNIEVGKPVRQEKDTTGPAYNVYPITVSAEGAAVRGTTLSIAGSQVAVHHTGRLTYNVSERDFPAGTHALFASATDGVTTETAEQQLQTAKAAAEALKPVVGAGTTQFTLSK